MNKWAFNRADDFMDSLKKLAENQDVGQELEEAIFKFRVDWMFLERRIKTFTKTMPDPMDDPRFYKQPPPKVDKQILRSSSV